ncbi:MAG: hypothetical protein GWO16_03690 [Gammaproteobacteria bacterium]|nr:hypothetical protein [Gammaproteobacteria bacterium]NIR97186.1 hypothetical protein [Gammaproteobacteria bacterium]NIT62903.1 hypothetical protein [Gammaproteobacteria bacterium]NIV19868.1 hypothetical protein [Gammaproteobacteria bacterium]NIY31483.1 hypothetical protein [Gammaproteobacteria bacterium]
MLLCEQFVALQMPKTGNAFVAEVLRRLFPGIQELEPDRTAGQIPASHRHLPRIGFCRNPWDWYVAWYHAPRRRGSSDPVFAAASADGARGFQDTLRHLLTGSRDFRSRLAPARAPNAVTVNRPCEEALGSIHPMTSLDIGFLTWRFITLFDAHAEAVFARARPPLGPPQDGEGVTIFGRAENLVQDLLAMLIHCGVPEMQARSSTTHDHPGNEPVQRRHYRDYYSPYLRELVAHKERVLIEAFEYQY